MRRLGLALLLIAVFRGITVDAMGARAGSLDERFDQAVRLIRRTSGPVLDSDAQLGVLALRQLKDPDLTPLLTAWCKSRNPFVQINGVLGLGEISADGKLDVWQLAQVKDAAAVARALTEAIESNLIDSKGIQELAASPDADPVIRSTLWLILASRGESIPVGPATELMRADMPQAARICAAIVLIHLGQTAGTAEALNELEDLPLNLREATTGALLESLWNYPVKAAADWTYVQATRSDASGALRFAATATLLKLDTARGEELWTQAYTGLGGSAGQRVRYLRALLDVAGRINPETFAPAVADAVPLVAGLGKIGRALAQGGDAVDECLDLIRQHHAGATDWVTIYSHDMKDRAAAARILEALIADSMVDGPALDERVQAASVAADRLMRIEPDGPAKVKVLLETARRSQHRLTEEAILSGVLRGLDPGQLRLIEGVAEWSSTRAESLATLMKARYSQTLESADLERLAYVFQGAGNVSPVTETQAAWLYLKRTDQAGQGLAAALANDDAEAGAPDSTEEDDREGG